MGDCSLVEAFAARLFGVQVVLMVSATVGFLQGLTVGWLLAIALVAIGLVKTQYAKSK